MLYRYKLNYTDTNMFTAHTHRTTSGMLKAQAAVKSGYLKMEGFSAKA